MWRFTDNWVGIHRKDDYAFFIDSVDPAQVPGYVDAINFPMYFWYDDGQGDCVKESNVVRPVWCHSQRRLIPHTTERLSARDDKCKDVEPPRSIHYRKGDRLETWGLDHIAWASAHVSTRRTGISMLNRTTMALLREYEHSCESCAPSITPTAG